MAGFLGGGDLYFNRKVNGVEQGFKRFGNAIKFEIKENTDPKKRISKQRDSYGDVIDEVHIRQAPEIEIELDDLNKDNIALVFLASVTSESVSSGSIVSEPVTVITLDSSVRLANGAVSNVVVKDVTDVTTYTVGTDYDILDAKLGLIYIIDGGAITAADILHITYDNALRKSNQILGGSESNIKMALLMNGKNFVDESDAEVNVWEAILSPDAGLDFLADDFNKLTLKGSLIRPDAKPSSYVVETDIVNA